MIDEHSPGMFRRKSEILQRGELRIGLLMFTLSKPSKLTCKVTGKQLFVTISKRLNVKNVL